MDDEEFEKRLDKLVGRAIEDVYIEDGTFGLVLDDGDGNWIDLATGATFRTEPHPGRGRATWRLENKVDLGAIRGAIALQQAGGAPIARYVPKDDDGGGRSGFWAGCLSVVTVLFTFTLICTGLLTLMYVLKTYDLWRYLPMR